MLVRSTTQEYLYRDGMKIVIIASLCSFANGSLLILDVGLQDEAEYECKATNNVGSGLIQKVRLDVIGEIFYNRLLCSSSTIYYY